VKASGNQFHECKVLENTFGDKKKLCGYIPEIFDVDIVLKIPTKMVCSKIPYF